MDLLLRRAMARLVDDLLVVAMQFVAIMVAAFYATLATGWNREMPTSVTVVAWLLVIFGAAAGLGYEAVSTRVGASIGKLLLGARVWDARVPQRLPWGRSTVRALLVTGPLPLLWLELVDGPGTQPTHRAILTMLVFGAAAWRTLLTFSVLAREDRAGLHDRIVGSVVWRPR